MCLRIWTKLFLCNGRKNNTAIHFFPPPLGILGRLVVVCLDVQVGELILKFMSKYSM